MEQDPVVLVHPHHVVSHLLWKTLVKNNQRSEMQKAKRKSRRLNNKDVVI